MILTVMSKKPTESASEDFSSNDVTVYDDNVESLLFESELKLLEDADMEFPEEIDAEEVQANVESNEVLQPEQDEEIRDPEEKGY